jgi:hypothetical protein
MQIEQNITLLDKILAPWRARIGADFDGYNNHVYRMLHCCFYLHPPSPQERHKMIIASAFHDIGIWSDHTVDYLAPSVHQAMLYLEEKGLQDWSQEIGLIIDNHHKLNVFKGELAEKYPLIEIYRQGDLVDFSLGIVRFGVPKDYISALKATFPNAGFHKRLVQLTWEQIKQRPLNPAPMMRW